MFTFDLQLFASKKGGGSTRNGRDSNAQRLGIKAYAGQFVTAGSIIVRQRGSKFTAGRHVKMAKDDSLFALTDGIVHFAPNHRVSIVAEEATPVAPQAAL